MKNWIVMVVFLAGGVMYGQNVEVMGKLKVVDGTQGVDKVFVSDANGEGKWITNRQLLINIYKDIPTGPQELINLGYSVWELWYGGVPHSKLQGLKLPFINGNTVDRYVVMLDTAGIDPTYETLITGAEGPTYQVWACTNTAINGADSQTNGFANTMDVTTGCTVPPNPMHIYRQLFDYMNGAANDTGWWIVSESEAAMLYTQLIAPGKWTPNSGGFANGAYQFWTSTESSGANEATKARRMNMTTGVITDELKTFQTRGLTLKKLNFQ